MENDSEETSRSGCTQEGTRMNLRLRIEKNTPKRGVASTERGLLIWVYRKPLRGVRKNKWPKPEAGQ